MTWLEAGNDPTAEFRGRVEHIEKGAIASGFSYVGDENTLISGVLIDDIQESMTDLLRALTPYGAVSLTLEGETLSVTWDDETTLHAVSSLSQTTTEALADEVAGAANRQEQP